MTKREILRFLETKQAERENILRSEYSERREQLLQKAYHDLGLTELALRIRPLLTEVCKLWDDWVAEHGSLDCIRMYSNCYSFAGHLRRYVDEEDAILKKIVNEDLNIGLEVVNKAYEDYKCQLACVRSAFSSVMATVRGMKTPKQAAIYLAKLGFDLSEIESPESQEQTPVTPVDTSFLFAKAA